MNFIKIFWIAFVTSSVITLFATNYLLQKELDKFKTSLRFQVEINQTRTFNMIKDFIASQEKKELENKQWEEEH
jgi:hypothetical protein